MFSNDQQDGHGILGSIVRSIRRKCSKIREKVVLKAAAGSCPKTKVLNLNSKPKNINKNRTKEPKPQYIWEIQGGDGHFIRSFNRGWVLERTGTNSNYRLRNPTTCRVLNLPDTEEKGPSHMSQVYLSSRKTFKMVLPFPNRENGSLSFKVLTIGEDYTWRTLDFPSTCKLTNAECLTNMSFDNVFVMGVIPETGSATIVFLEAESEKLWTIDVPQDFTSNESKNIVLVSWAGKPALARKLENGVLYVCVVEDYKTQKWARKDIMVDLKYMNKDAWKNYTPCKFYGNKLWMHCKLEERLTFDMVSKVVTQIDVPKTPGAKLSSQPSLMDLEGSKPFKE